MTPPRPSSGSGAPPAPVDAGGAPKTAWSLSALHLNALAWERFGLELPLELLLGEVPLRKVLASATPGAGWRGAQPPEPLGASAGTATHAPAPYGQDAMWISERAFGGPPHNLVFVALLEGALAFGVMLRRFTGRQRLAVGIPAAGRSVPELQRLVGLCSNIVPVVLDLQDDATVAEQVASVQRSVAAPLAHSDLPFPEVLSAVGAGGEAGFIPYVQLVFAMHDRLIDHDFTSGGPRAARWGPWGWRSARRPTRTRTAAARRPWRPGRTSPSSWSR